MAGLRCRLRERLKYARVPFRRRGSNSRGEIMAAEASIQLKDIITWVIAVGGVAWGVLQYRSSAARDFIRPVREAQLKLYQEATSAAATLATAEPDSKEWDDARKNFFRLYY